MSDRTKKEFLSAYDEYADAIYRHCFFRVFSKARAEELVQETFMKAWQYMEEGNKVDNKRAFLYRVATNLIIDDSRKKKEGSLEQLIEDEVLTEPGYDGAKDVERGILLKDVLNCIKDLPEDYRDVLLMRFVDDMDPREIAKVLDTTPNNISVRLNRAMKALKLDFSAEGGSASGRDQ